jgi:hypothetical protein
VKGGDSCPRIWATTSQAPLLNIKVILVKLGRLRYCFFTPLWALPTVLFLQTGKCDFVMSRTLVLGTIHHRRLFHNGRLMGDLRCAEESAC